MKYKLLLLFILSGFAFINACGGDDEEVIVDEGTGFTAPTDVAGMANLLGGDGKDSVVWVGQKWTQAAWDPFTLDYSKEEEDITDKPDVRFKEHTIWFKHDDYNTPRFGYPVGKGKWIDPLGKTGFYYELEVGVLDKIFVNTREEYPPAGGRQDWENLKVTENTIEFTRKWKYGSKSVQDRFVWVKK